MATQETVQSIEVASLRQSGGLMELALMEEADFETRLSILSRGQERQRRIQHELMVPDEDYGIIPGTKKPTLLKPGAEKLCVFYGLVATFREEWIEGDGLFRPHLRVKVTCELHRGSKDGPVAGEGAGASNSWEKKHRYRGAQRGCPSCGVEGTIRRSSFEKDGDKGWYCNAKAGGCGDSFHSTDTRITEQQGGQVDNPDPYDVENTLLKMAMKRAQVDAALRTTATSGLFTQDLEDAPPDNHPQPRQTSPVIESEPGSDDEPVFDSEGNPLEPEAERVAAAGAEPNGSFDQSARRETRSRTSQPARRSAPANGTDPLCPHCGRPAKPSKFPKPGQSHYCYGCKHSFSPEAGA